MYENKKIIWIGGSPCSGKSTSAEYIAKQCGYQYIKIDDYMMTHIKKAEYLKHPVMFKWKSTNWCDLFSRDYLLLFKEEVEFYKECFQFLLGDLRKDIKGDFVVVEGCGLMPELIKDKIDKDNIIYLIPSSEFQINKYKEREWAKDILKSCNDPKLTFSNWMKRDIEFGKYIKKTATLYDYDVLVVDENLSITEMLNTILHKFELSVKNVYI